MFCYLRLEDREVLSVAPAYPHSNFFSWNFLDLYCSSIFYHKFASLFYDLGMFLIAKREGNKEQVSEHF